MEYAPVELAYEEHGTGTPLVLVHGFPLNRTIWKPVAEKLQGSMRCILPDLRGFGGSPATDGIYSMRLMAGDIAELLDRLGIEKVFIAGHSMGGYVALAFTRAFPQRVAGLGLIASFAGADSPERRQVRYVEAEEVRKQGVSLVADGMAPKLTYQPELSRKLHDLMTHNDVRAVSGALMGMAEREDQTEFLSTVKYPILIVAGKKDVIIPAEKSRELVSHLKNCRLVEIDEASHMPMLEAPSETAAALEEWIKQAAL